MSSLRSSIVLLSTPMLAAAGGTASQVETPAMCDDRADAAGESDEPARNVAPWRAPSGRTTFEAIAFIGRHDSGERDFGGGLLLSLPLDRLWTPKPIVRTAPQVTAPPAPAPATPPALPRLSPSLARACVAAAWRAHGLGGMGDLDDLSGRARMSGLLPEARFRASRSWNRGQKLLPADADSYRLQDSTTDSQLLEGRLTWRLDRLLFTDDEIAVERLRMQRIQQRTQLADKVLVALFDWQRARQASENAALTDEEKTEAWLRAAQAEATLDVLTGGWFSGWLAKSGA